MLTNLLILLFFLLLLIFSISKWKVHPFVALLLTAIALALSFGFGGEKSIEVLLAGFSGTLKGIAIVIILGAFIGEVLQETGGAFRIANHIIKWLGKKKLPWAMGFTGYIISIPVFVDVAYILLQPVVESLSVKSKRPVLYIGLSLAAGLTVAHTLIPPTPGPLAVADSLGLEIGRMLSVNLFVALFAMAGGVLWVLYFVKNSWLAYDDKLATAAIDNQEKDKFKSIDYKGNVFYDILPILVPILFIGLGSFISFEVSSTFLSIFIFCTTPIVAVFIGAIIAVFQISTKNKLQTSNRLIEQAIVKSALVIMITGAGGSLGYVIRQTGMQDEIVTIFAQFPFLGILLPFIVAAILTTSTGSITVSLVGTASMLGSIVDTLPMSPEIVAALIGCGSFCVFHANSSFFWLLNKLHEVPPKVLYRTFTMQSLVMGFSGLIGVFILILFGF